MKFIAKCLVLLVVSAPLAAQNANYIWKLTNTSYVYQVGLDTPVACDSRMITGFQHWNSASQFDISQSGQFFSGPINPANPSIQIQMEPASNLSDPSYLAEAPPGSFVAWTVVDGTTVQELQSAHVRINADYWASGTLFCGTGSVPSTSYDYAYVVAHEAGHVLGMGHGNPPLPSSCVLAAPLTPGVSLFARCATETARAVVLYGVP